MMDRRLTILVSVAIWITACASPAASIAPSPSTTQTTANGCESIDVRTPSGERVDLTGTWQVVGVGPLYYVSQIADCVWIAGVFRSEDEPLTLLGLDYAFDGHLRPDLTVRGRWGSLDYEDQRRAYGTEIWTVEVEVDPWTMRTSSGDIGTLERVSDSWNNSFEPGG